MHRLRPTWEEFLRDAPATRYLFGRGEAQLNTPEPEFADADEDQIKDFLKRLSREEDLRFLARVFFLLQPDVREFLFEKLPRLLRSLTHTSVPQTELSRGAIRGHVQWTPTIRQRLAGKGDATTYVVRRGERSSDVPENRLLRLFLECVLDAVGEATRAAGTKQIPSYLNEVRVAAADALREPHLRQVKSVPTTTARMRQLAQRHRDPRYGSLLKLVDRYDDSVRDPRWRSVLELLRVGWLEPISDDDLFEVYSIALLLHVFVEDLGFRVQQYGLIRAGRDAIAVLEDEAGTRVRMWFDQNPASIFDTRSEYTYLTTAYRGLSGSARRPDVILSADRQNGVERRLFAEIKRTEGGQYQRDSLYKAFGYLHDFGAVWEKRETHSPKAVVLFPSGVAPSSGHQWLANNVACVATDNQDQVRRILETLIGESD